VRPTLVTGASGFLGWHVARLLEARGERVRALVRQPGPIDGLNCETVVGDLRDRASLARAVAGCGSLFHVAADYRLWVKDPADMHRSNVIGTRDLLAAAREAGVERAVYTSTVGCIGFVPAGLADETSPVSLADMTGPYKQTKFQAEEEARQAARDFDVVIVNPTAPVGERDWKPTPTGKTILDFLKGKIPAFVDTGLNLVDVHDCALGHVLAREKGRRGERYILGSENLSLQEILARLAALTGRRAPTTQIPHWIAYVAGWCSTQAAALTGREPGVPLDAVKMAKKKMYATSAKAGRELGYQPANTTAALARAIDWYQAHHYVTQTPRANPPSYSPVATPPGGQP
jgi:dihydroflavonol-4-reductase